MYDFNGFTTVTDEFYRNYSYLLTIRPVILHVYVTLVSADGVGLVAKASRAGSRGPDAA